MRKPILLLAAVAIGTAACSAGTTSSADPRAAVPLAHHLATEPPFDPYEPEPPLETPYEGPATARGGGDYLTPSGVCRRRAARRP